jgi:hypothetical protein
MRTDEPVKLCIEFPDLLSLIDKIQEEAGSTPNEKRAARAHRALRAFGLPDDEPLEEVVQDLVTNLLHFIDKRKGGKFYNADKLLDKAFVHFVHEQNAEARVASTSQPEDY